MVVKRIGLILCLVGMLAACSPDYNWRQVAVGGGAVQAIFPDKPQTHERTLNYSGHDISFGLTSANVDGTSFTVAYAPLPEALRNDAGAGKELAGAVMRSLYHSLGAEQPAQLPELGKPFVIDAVPPQKPLRLRATVWLTDQALVEGLVMAEQERFPEQQADEFLRGIELAR